MKKVEVKINGDSYKILARNELERIIKETKISNLVEKVLYYNEHSGHVVMEIDAETGEVIEYWIQSGWRNIDEKPTIITLFSIDTPVDFDYPDELLDSEEQDLWDEYLDEDGELDIEEWLNEYKPNGKNYEYRAIEFLEYYLEDSYRESDYETEIIEQLDELYS